MLRAVRFARTRKVPFFGICLGMECAVIEFARSVCGLQADSSEFDAAAPHRVFYMLRELLGTDIMGGNMRLGAFPCVLDEDSLAYQVYGKREISERHRHRYEFNREYEDILSSYGMKFSGNSPDRNFVEMMELPGHPWFLGCQFHPEFKSRPLEPHPLFAGFIGAALRHRLERKSTQRGPREEEVKDARA
jgi:CTP synthase